MREKLVTGIAREIAIVCCYKRTHSLQNPNLVQGVDFYGGAKSLWSITGVRVHGPRASGRWRFWNNTRGVRCAPVTICVYYFFLFPSRR
jgi:hypothetical protein